MSLAQQMIGKWEGVLPRYVSADYLTGKHTACPICNDGKDRFRFDNRQGRGTFFCTHCGSGDGFDLLMGVTGKSFKEIAKELDPDSVTAAIPKPPPKTGVLIDAIASKCRLLTEGDSVLTYLGNRGINVVPESVRMAANLKHYHDGKTAFFDAMVARISDPDGKRMGFHVTWLKDGLKAPVDVSRKIYKQGETINGGGVYLGPVREEMVIGEGIETTLAGMQLINASGIAALNAGQMTKIQLPDAVKAVVILADNDSRFTGQKAAYTLASRLFAEGWSVRVVVPSEPDTDFADQL